jgi:hypothetical protein
MYLRSCGCHLSEQTGSLGTSGLGSSWGRCRRLLGRVSSSRSGSLLGSGRGLCGGRGSRPARGRSSTLTGHFDDELGLGDGSGVGLTWWWLGNSKVTDGNGELRFWSSEVFENHRR